MGLDIFRSEVNIVNEQNPNVFFGFVTNYLVFLLQVTDRAYLKEGEINILGS